MERMERREFLKSLAGVTASLMVPAAPFALSGCSPSDRLGELLPRRMLGRTGEKVTMLGIGGWHIGGKMSETEAQAVIERVLEKTDIFETCQMPVNLLDPSYESFIERVLPTLTERNIGVLAMKTLSNGRFFGTDQKDEQEVKPALIPNRVSVAEAIHFVWSLPVSVLITGPDDRKQMAEKIELARSFKTMDKTRRQALVNRVWDLAGNTVEYYKA